MFGAQFTKFIADLAAPIFNVSGCPMSVHRLGSFVSLNDVEVDCRSDNDKL